MWMLGGGKIGVRNGGERDCCWIGFVIENGICLLC